MQAKMSFKNPNVKPLMSEGGVLLAPPSKLITKGCIDKSSQFDLEFLQWLISNEKEIQFYKSKEWLLVRGNILERDKHECQLCKYNGMLTIVRTRAYIHHISELKLFPNLCMNYFNLITLCHNCHEITHGRDWNKPKEILTETFENFDGVERW